MKLNIIIKLKSLETKSIQWVLFLMLTFTWCSANSQERFPDKCLGIWEGKMYIYNQGVLRDSVDVILTIEVITDTTWTWKTEYLSVRYPIIKDYKLKHLGKNIYVTDEGDGIELLNYQFGNKLFSTFETEGIYLTANYELKNDQLFFEVTSGKKKNGEDSVINYSIDNVQNVIFKKR